MRFEAKTRSRQAPESIKIGAASGTGVLPPLALDAGYRRTNALVFNQGKFRCIVIIDSAGIIREPCSD
jgi:hypothetical protein